MFRRSIRAVAALLPLALAIACSSSSASSSGKSVDAGAKLPSLDAGKAAGQGKRGGTGSTQPTASSQGAASATTSSPQRRPVQVDGDNPCADVADGKATCGSGTALYFCAGQQLYQVDCNALMTASSSEYASGACYQTDTVTDCFGCGATADGSSICCASATSGASLCCDDTSACALVTP